MSDFVLPGARRDVSRTEPPRWVEVAEDLFIGSDALQVFLKTAGGEIRLRFGPKTWEAVIKTVQTLREEIGAKKNTDRQTLEG